MASRCMLLVGVGLLGTAVLAFEEEAFLSGVLLDDAGAPGQVSEDSILSLRQLRSRQTFQDSAHRVPEGEAIIDESNSTSFCCFSFSSAKDKCGSCLLVSKAKAGDYCSAPSTCGGCGGYWCTPLCTRWKYKVDTLAPGLGEPEGSLVQHSASQGFEEEMGSDGPIEEAIVDSANGTAFCCGLYTDAEDKCGSCQLKAPTGDFSATRGTCGGSGGHWCTPQCVHFQSLVDPSAAPYVKQKPSVRIDRRRRRHRRRHSHRRHHKAIAPAEEKHVPATAAPAAAEAEDSVAAPVPATTAGTEADALSDAA